MHAIWVQKLQHEMTQPPDSEERVAQCYSGLQNRSVKKCVAIKA